MKCVLCDYWDTSNKVDWKFKKLPSIGDTFEKEEVTYRIERIGKLRGKKLVAIVRMIKYKIANTSTQFVHKCPAKRDATEKMSRDDVIKLEQKHGKDKAAQIMNERVKIRSTGHQINLTCPYCKTVFWKERFALPQTVQVGSTMNKKRLRKRA